MNRANTRGFHRFLYAGQLSKVRLIKRGDDQLEGAQTNLTLFDVRWSRYSKTGEPIQSDVTSEEHRVLQIPRVQLERAGVNYISAADRFVELDGPSKGSTWQPESTTQIEVRLFENQVFVGLLRTDPA